ncbi:MULTISPECIES: iron-sulfur cluster insertion protein ErpA [unclassified Paenibacillus]|uniref:iron-sulfur cluster insertion protein ErpA n=1 Tax=unclassified Paenibacillus TaxID=185978 RepID=UPI001AE3C6C2|nr:MULTISPECIES: iron-sulfur cluster insertion protein ErpA [unclassified Paenibacillus]MBP1154369.1 iron-sulfur cluster assembly protein [Paenibacillus sp. PvP091]MBP1170247.1 iron-sulfur cluster assembly protein [Paenibacillus sp. PvR098]MBP2441275.1 iron-sulfur cluster assembly protein [Paenibacillus sp. PvP052]
MITISESACDKIKEMLAAEEASNLFLRIGVKAGGCSGFSYGMGFDDNQEQDDTVLDIHGLKVVVDQESAKYLYGVEIDFQDAGMGGGFTIQNPNAVASCGCGSSFKVKDEEGTPEKCDDKVEA